MQEPSHTTLPTRTDLTSQCVRCGLCLPHCPTYQLHGTEAESPRGRIMLLAQASKAEAWNHDDITDAIAPHVDRCTACFRCADVCPAHVDYPRILAEGRAWLNQHRSSTRTPRLRRYARHALNRLMTWPWGIRMLTRMWRRSASWLTHIPVWGSKLPLPEPKENSPPTRHEPPEAWLFSGCVGHVEEAALREQAQHVLNRLGTHAQSTPEAWCCGALAKHEGYPDLETKAVTSLQRSMEALSSPTQPQPLITFASGCHDQIRHALPDHHVQDICSFLVAHPQWHTLSPRAIPKRVAWHVPCTHRHGTAKPDAVFAMLSAIPELTLLPLTDTACCGAAGSHMLFEADQARALATPLVQQVQHMQADIMVSTNIGCRLHLRRALREAGVTAEVIHPVTLLSRSLS